MSVDPQVERKQTPLVESKREIVEGLLDGKEVAFLYSADYNIVLDFNRNGTTLVTDSDGEYTVNRGLQQSAVGDFCEDMWRLAERVKSVLATIPEGNLQRDMGGRSALINAYLLVQLAEGYYSHDPLDIRQGGQGQTFEALVAPKGDYAA